MKKTILQASVLTLCGFLFVNQPVQGVSEQVMDQWRQLVTETDENEMEKMMESFILHPEGREGFSGFSYADSWSLVWKHYVTIKEKSESSQERAFASKALAKLVARHKYVPEGIFREDIEALKTVPVSTGESRQDEQKIFLSTHITPSEHRVIEEMARATLSREKIQPWPAPEIHSGHYEGSHKQSAPEERRFNVRDNFSTDKDSFTTVSPPHDQMQITPSSVVRHQKSTTSRRFSPFTHEDNSERASSRKKNLGYTYVDNGLPPVNDRILEVYLELRERNHGKDPKRSDIWDQVNGEGYAVSLGQIRHVISNYIKNKNGAARASTSTSVSPQIRAPLVPEENFSDSGRGTPVNTPTGDNE